MRQLIRDTVPISTGKTKILFNSPQLRDFFTTTCSELDLMTGRVYMYLLPAEDIGVPCQQEEFDLNLLERMTPNSHRSNETWYRGSEENPTDQENSSSSRRHGHDGDRGKARSVLPIMGTLCGSIM